MDSVRSAIRWLAPAIGSLFFCVLISCQGFAQGRVEELADRAFWNSKQAQAIVDARGIWSVPQKWSLAKKNSTPQEHSFLLCISKEWENQVRFESAVNALRSHYAIAACQMGLEVNSQAMAYAKEQEDVQEELIEFGGQVEDTTQIKRVLIELEDRRVELEASLKKLRQELALLVGSELACSYNAEFLCAPTADLHDPCDYEAWAIDQRRELQVLRYARQHIDLINQESLDILGGMVFSSTSLRAILGQVKPSGWLNHKPSSEQLAKRAAALDRTIADRAQQIRVETNNAYTDKASALERWKLAVAKSDTLAERVERLAMLAELKGNLPLQIQAKLDLYAARGLEVQRWLDWYLADCDLQNASGRIGYWND